MSARGRVSSARARRRRVRSETEGTRRHENNRRRGDPGARAAARSSAARRPSKDREAERARRPRPLEQLTEAIRHMDRRKRCGLWRRVVRDVRAVAKIRLAMIAAAPPSVSAPSASDRAPGLIPRDAKSAALAVEPAGHPPMSWKRPAAPFQPSTTMRWVWPAFTDMRRRDRGLPLVAGSDIRQRSLLQSTSWPVKQLVIPHVEDRVEVRLRCRCRSRARRARRRSASNLSTLPRMQRPSRRRSQARFRVRGLVPVNDRRSAG